MSGVTNVVVGALGGVMAIGLSLAGGSHMGPQWREASETAKAAMTLSAVQQTGQAAVMAAMEGEGPSVGLPGLRRLIEAGWLSGVPRNPTSDQPSASPVPIVASDGRRYVSMDLIGDDGSLCAAVARQAGLGAPVSDVGADGAHAGCARTSRGSVAFVRM